MVCFVVCRSCVVYWFWMIVFVFCKRFLLRMIKVREIDFLIGVDVFLWKFYVFFFFLVLGIVLLFGLVYVFIIFF